MNLRRPATRLVRARPLMKRRARRPAPQVTPARRLRSLAKRICHMECCLWLYYSELRHSDRPDWLRPGQWQHYVWFHLYHDLCSWLHRHSRIAHVPVQRLLDNHFRLHDSQLRHARRRHRLRQRQRLDYLRLRFYDDLYYRLHRNCCLFDLPGRRDLDGSIWLHHR